jgi:rSAM/selenodomain-associated transferase 1
MPDTALVVMARYPEPGKTKTRLARSIGDDEAVRLYRGFLTDLANKFAKSRFNLHWAYTPVEVDYEAFLASIVPSLVGQMRCLRQEGPDLGAHLHHAFKWTRARRFQHTIVIGSDSPHISLDHIEQARLALDEADVVLGPAEDGGYYLIAMRDPYDVFSGIPMSTSAVLEMTMEMAQRQGLKISLLESLFDVDELVDLMRLVKMLREDESLAPATAALCKELPVRV